MKAYAIYDWIKLNAVQRKKISRGKKRNRDTNEINRKSVSVLNEFLQANQLILLGIFLEKDFVAFWDTRNH